MQSLPGAAALHMSGDGVEPLEMSVVIEHKGMPVAHVVVFSGDPDMLDLYVQVLHDRFGSVDAVNDVEEIRTLARHGVVQAVLIDVRDRNGWCSCLQLRRSPETAGVPLIVLTAYVAPDRRYRRLASRLGCAAYVAKPSLPEKLVEIVDRVVCGERGIEQASVD